MLGYAELHSNRVAARHFGVDEKRVREWKKQKDVLEWTLPQKKRRLDGGGRKAALPGVEEELVIWIDEMRAENQQVRCSGIQQKVLSIIRERGETSDFAASRGWYVTTSHCAGEQQSETTIRSDSQSDQLHHENPQAARAEWLLSLCDWKHG